MKRYARLYRLFVSQYLKSLMQSKVDFLVGLFGFLLTQATGIAFLFLIFEQIPALNGWTFEQLLFIYGFAQIPRGLDHLFTDNIWFLAWRMIIRADFDRYLLRPMNPFFQIVCDKFQPDAFGELMVGSILVGISIANGTVTVTVAGVALFIVSIIAGSLIYTSIKLFYASLSFWITDSSPVLQVAYDTAEFAKYPVDIYSRAVRVAITWVVPFAFVAYYPASFFLKESNLWKTIGIECILAIVLWCISYKVFKRGSMIYESAGN